MNGPKAYSTSAGISRVCPGAEGGSHRPRKTLQGMLELVFAFSIPSLTVTQSVIFSARCAQSSVPSD